MRMNLAYCIIRDVGDVINTMYGDSVPPILLMGHRYVTFLYFNQIQN